MRCGDFVGLIGECGGPGQLGTWFVWHILWFIKPLTNWPYMGCTFKCWLFPAPSRINLLTKINNMYWGFNHVPNTIYHTLVSIGTNLQIVHPCTLISDYWNIFTSCREHLVLYTMHAHSCGTYVHLIYTNIDYLVYMAWRLLIICPKSSILKSLEHVDGCP